jgi:Leucine-rich repeat (LRR) protein
MSGNDQFPPIPFPPLSFKPLPVSHGEDRVHWSAANGHAPQAAIDEKKESGFFRSPFAAVNIVAQATFLRLNRLLRYDSSNCTGGNRPKAAGYGYLGCGRSR